MKLQLVPSQVAWEALAGTWQTVQEAPQPVTSPLVRHKPLQAWVPVGQAPEQVALLAMQAPLHRVSPVGQEPPQDVPSQVAVPFGGTGQGEQALPQLLVSLLETHWPPHICCAAEQTGAASTATDPPLPIGASAPVPPAPPLPIGASAPA